MTPEERLHLLKGLLGRIRTNAGERLSGSDSGDDEFLRRSVLDARELEETQEGSAAIRAAAAEADLAARAAARGAIEHVAAPARPGGNGSNGSHGARPPPPLATEASAPLELDLFDPFEDEIEPEGAALDASGEHLVAPVAPARDDEDGQDEDGADEDEALFEDEDFDRAPDTSHDRGEAALGHPHDEARRAEDDLGDDDDAVDLETNRPPPRGSFVPIPPPSSRRATGWTDLPPAAISRIVATGSPGPYSDEVTEDRAEGPGLELTFDEPAAASGPPEPRRAFDPLAQTAQNPIPAAMFERAILDEEEEEVEEETGARDGDLLGEETLAAMERDAQRQASGTSEVESREPISSRQPVDPDQPVDLGLESEPPPESGEMASQRQPATASLHDLVHDLDEVTPHAEESDRVADQARPPAAEPSAERAPVEMMPAASPVFGPVIVGRAPLAAATFVEVLDAALAFGEPGG